jgi:4-hydroxy-3-methylbut-2-enyl diphosphate reductase
LADPWVSAAKKYTVGSAVEGKVVRIAPFGAFVELEPGIDGLVHISQLSNDRVAKVEDAVRTGQKVKAKVIANDPEKKRLSLSMKENDGEVDKKEYQAYMGEQQSGSGVTIGEILKESGMKL